MCLSLIKETCESYQRLTTADINTWPTAVLDSIVSRLINPPQFFLFFFFFFVFFFFFFFHFWSDVHIQLAELILKSCNVVLIFDLVDEILR